MQEASLEGQDKAFKDVIEPLESVSLNIAPTTRKSLAEAGTPDEVAASLTTQSAGSNAPQVAVLSAGQVLCGAPRRSPLRLTPLRAQRVDDAKNTYYFFEFTSTARGVKRHAITTLAVVNGMPASPPLCVRYSPPLRRRQGIHAHDGRERGALAEDG